MNDFVLLDCLVHHHFMVGCHHLREITGVHGVNDVDNELTITLGYGVIREVLIKF